MGFRQVAAVLLLVVVFGCVSDAWISRWFYPRLGFLHDDEVSAQFDTQKLVQEDPVGEDPVGQEPSEPVVVPVGQEPGIETSRDEDLESFQSKQTFENPLTWLYPTIEKHVRNSTAFQRLKQVAANGVVAWCGKSVVRVEVKQELLGIGRLVQPERITLGGCAAIEEDAEARVLTFESELHGCGSELMMTEDVLIYTFSLVYEPKPPANISILNTSKALVDIECHYLRNHEVSSNSLKYAVEPSNPVGQEPSQVVIKPVGWEPSIEPVGREPSEQPVGQDPVGKTVGEEQSKLFGGLLGLETSKPVGHEPGEQPVGQEPSEILGNEISDPVGQDPSEQPVAQEPVTQEPVGEQPVGQPLGQEPSEHVGEPVGQGPGEPVGQGPGEPVGEQPVGQELSQQPVGEPLGQEPSDPFAQESSEHLGEPLGQETSEHVGEPVDHEPGEPVGKEPSEPVGQEPSEQPAGEPLGKEPSEPVGQEPSEILGNESSEQPVGQEPHQPVAQEPVGHEPGEQPVSQEPVGEHPVGQPLGQEPSDPLGQESSEHVEEPAGQKPVGEQSVGQEQSQQPVGEPVGQEPSEPVGQEPSEPVGQEPSKSVGQEPSQHVAQEPVGHEPGEHPVGEPLGQEPSEHVGEPVGQPPGEQPVGEPVGYEPGEQPVDQEPSEPVGQQPVGEEPVGHEPVGQERSELMGEQPVGQELSQQSVGEPLGQEPSEHVGGLVGHEPGEQNVGQEPSQQPMGQHPVGEQPVGHDPVVQVPSEPVGQEPSEQPVGEPLGQEPSEHVGEFLGQEPSEPVGQHPVGEQSVGQVPCELVGQEPSEQSVGDLVGQEPSQQPVGQLLGQVPSEPVGQHPVGEQPVGQHPVGEQPVGQEPSEQLVGQDRVGLPLGQKPIQDEDPESSQSKQVSENPLTWSYPEVAKPEYRPTVSERLKQVAANSVSAQCGKSVVRVQVNQDLLGIGRLIQPERITLGGCVATEEDAEAHVITFESELHGCGSELTMTEDVLIYTFTLVYEPKPLANTSIVKTSAAMVDIECHYLRNHVSSNALKPTWVPNTSNMVAEELFYFSLRLMTADWQFERPSNHYYLGDIINMEASVMPYHHVPLRVFVDRCVATLAPEVNTVPRYSFIEDHGCLVDAKLTGSSSHFLSRSQDDKIQFQLESFRFQPQNDSKQLYITCHLKASAASSPIDAENKACSFTDGWKAAGGDDLVCGCCDSSCAVSKARDLDSELDMQKEGEATLGPIMVQE